MTKIVIPESRVDIFEKFYWDAMRVHLKQTPDEDLYEKLEKELDEIRLTWLRCADG